ncbi:hypothetical protein [Rhodococcus wratislaviensis]|uniref:hypothetical protein n=1 Tax=Rhodococcus wratislaviensis TaxID=44752 RepID=UPI0035113D31
MWVDPIATPQEPGQRMVVASVRFAPGARTAWHSHESGQTLHITDGVALIGTRDGTVIRATPRPDHLHPARRGALARITHVHIGDGPADS